MTDQVRRIRKGKSGRQAPSGSQPQRPPPLAAAAALPRVPSFSKLEVSGSPRSLSGLREYWAKSQDPVPDVTESEIPGIGPAAAFHRAQRGSRDARPRWSAAALPYCRARNRCRKSALPSLSLLAGFSVRLCPLRLL